MTHTRQRAAWIAHEWLYANGQRVHRLRGEPEPCEEPRRVLVTPPPALSASRSPIAL